MARTGSLRFTGQLLLSLTNEGETCWFCQGLPLSGELSSAARLRGFSQKPPSPSRLCRATSPERERLWQGRKVYGLQVGFFCLLCQVLALEGKDLPQPETKRGTSCRRRRLRGFLSRTIYLHRGFGRSIKYTGHTRTPPVTARSVLSRSQRACPMRKKIGWRGFASRVKSFFRFLFSRKKERELSFS